MVSRTLVSRRHLLTAVLVVCAVSSALGFSAAAARAGLIRPLIGSFGSGTLTGVAVNQETGNVYVANGSAGTVNVFGPSGGSPVGEVPAEIGGLGNAGGEPEGLAVDNSCYYQHLVGSACEAFDPSNGDVYLANAAASTVQKLALNVLSHEYEIVHEFPFQEVNGVAVDQQGNMYVADYFDEAIHEFNTNSEEVGAIAQHTVAHPAYVAVGAPGVLYLGSYEGGVAKIEVGSHDEVIAEAVFDADGRAVAVDQQGDVLVDDKASVSESDASGQPLGRFGDSGLGALTESFGIAVSDASGRVYVSDRGNAGSVSIYGPGAPSPPVLGPESASDIAITGATLRATINPMEAATTYKFEYGLDSSYGASVPVPSAHLPAATTDQPVSQVLSGLRPGTTYHFRVVATSANGTITGPDRQLKTYAGEAGGADACLNADLRGLQSSSYLPDCRAYEMVSPVEKGSANIAAAPLGMTQSSLNGDAIKYTSVFAFGNATGIEQRGAEYLSRREASGWTSEPINPPQESRGSNGIGIGISVQYEALSADLSKGVFYAGSPVLPGHPNVEQDTNLYLRTDVFAAPPGTYELLTDSTTPLAATPQNIAGVALAGASADYSHIIFESNNDLTPETNGLDQTLPKLYEWVNGAVTLAGVLPDGLPAPASIAGKGAGGGLTQYVGGQTEYLGDHNWELNAISADGSRVIFEGPPFLGHNVSFGNGDTAGNLYMRTDEARTIQLNASERTLPTPNKAQSSTPPVVFEGATADDSKVFFTSTALMTDDAGGESISAAENDRNLYMYDLNAPVGKRLTLISVDHEPSDDLENSCGCGEDRANGVLADGISEDGSYVYFLGDNKLVAGQTREFAGRELFVWHDGTVRALAEYAGGFASVEHQWGAEQPQDQREFRVTPDGKHALFVSALPSTGRRAGNVNLTPRTAGTPCASLSSELPLCQELFLYDYETGRITCASCNPTGEAPNGRAAFEDRQDTFTTGQGDTEYLTRPMTPDGRYVFFDSPDPLVPQDTNGKRDVYEYDVQTGRVSLISGGVSVYDSTFVDASADGSNVFFTTRQQLVRADDDGKLRSV